MQQKKSPTPFDGRIELTYALIALAILIAVLFTSACVSVSDSKAEPVWKPNVFLFSRGMNDRCAFVNGAGVAVQCDEPMIHDYYLAPLEDLVTLKSKLQQCDQWR